jgi:hypothetical protein
MKTLLTLLLYTITTETGMPHLEENLRYATTHETVCLDPDELHRRFPILRSPALADCHLGQQSENTLGTSFPLVCANNHGTTGGTTGGVLWTTYGVRSTGTLSIRLGGKNMTLYQRVTAISRGPCGTNRSR